MTYAEWQAECARISEEVAKADREVKALQSSGDWATVSVVQGKYYALRDELKVLQARVPDANGVVAGEQPLTYEEWLSERDWISHDLDAVKIEWDEIRAAGDWTAAQGPQEKYYLLRKRQDAHNAKMPRKRVG